MKSLPYLLGASLFLIGAVRFFTRFDFVGAIITGLAACLAFSGAYIQYKKEQ